MDVMLPPTAFRLYFTTGLGWGGEGPMCQSSRCPLTLPPLTFRAYCLVALQGPRLNTTRATTNNNTITIAKSQNPPNPHRRETNENDDGADDVVVNDEDARASQSA